MHADVRVVGRPRRNHSSQQRLEREHTRQLRTINQESIAREVILNRKSWHGGNEKKDRQGRCTYLTQA